MLDLPTGFRSDFVQCGNVHIHLVHNGAEYMGVPIEDDRPAILLLHGFPEFWMAWEAIMPHLHDDFLVLVPDQRGYNASDAPIGVKNYRTGLLVADMIALTSAVLGERPFNLVGHDWGASVAYALAIGRPDLVDKLIIANGVHPVCFQNALIDDSDQAKASAYIHILKSDVAPARMAEAGFARTFSMFEKFSSAPWLTEALKEKYRSAWASKTRLAAMLNWYSSSPLVVPEPGKEMPDAVLYNAPTDKFRISMPHLLIWGAKDTALLPSATAQLEQFCDDVSRIEYPEADHWLLHTHGEAIATDIREFLLG